MIPGHGAQFVVNESGAPRAVSRTRPWWALPLTACLAAACLALGGCDNRPVQRDTAPGNDLTSDLAGHWTFDEGQGDVARDITGNGHDAALKNVGWVPSPRGHAARFTAKESLAKYGNRETMNLSGDLTLAVWVKTDASVAPKTHRLIFGDSGPGVLRNSNLAVDSQQRLSFEWGNGQEHAALYAPAGLLDGGWKHVVAVADSAALQVTLYVDGAAVVQMPMPISKTAAKERLTGWFHNGFFQGDLDDIRLYSRALNAAEVNELFRSQADLTVGQAVVLRDASSAEPRGFVSVPVRNLGLEQRRIEVTGTESRDIVLAPGGETSVTLGRISLQPVFPGRTDLYVGNRTQELDRLKVFNTGGDAAESDAISVSLPEVIEPLQVAVHAPWQAGMKPGKTDRMNLDVQLAVPEEQLNGSKLRVRLVSHESGAEVLTQDIASPKETQSLALDVKSLPWGSYDLIASFQNADGTEIARTTQVATVLPGGPQQIRVLNNLVSELMDARSRKLLGSSRIEFMNPRKGWVWLRAAGACEVKLGGTVVLAAGEGQPAVEAMRLLPVGKHVLETSGKPTDLTVRAIPYLAYNVFPSTPRIASFGPNTWERLKAHMLPNVNMIESPQFDTPESRAWMAQGKLWIRNVQAPGLLDNKTWTVDNLRELWLNPGKSTAWPEIPGLDISKVSGVQVDEYGSGTKSLRVMEPVVKSIAELSENPAFAGKYWIPFLIGGWGTTPEGILFFKTVWGAGWPFAEEVYLGELSGEKANLNQIRSKFRALAALYERAQPGAVRRMLFTLMYSYMPFCMTNRCPESDFRVHLDMQMQTLATDPAFFGLGGVQPYRSNYVNEEILNCMGRMLRHYAIEGRTDRMLTNPYELQHIANPEFAEGAKQWVVTAAEEGSVTPGKLAGYGSVQGRYPASLQGDTFLLMRRSAKAANVLSQEIKGLTPGRLYSLKLITADYADLKAGKTRNAAVPVSVAVDGAAVQPGGFSESFPSDHTKAKLAPFNTKESTFWMTYHYLTFRATGPTAQLTIKDWPSDTDPGGPVGQQVMVNFVEIQPVLESADNL